MITFLKGSIFFLSVEGVLAELVLVQVSRMFPVPAVPIVRESHKFLVIHFVEFHKFLDRRKSYQSVVQMVHILRQHVNSPAAHFVGMVHILQ